MSKKLNSHGWQVREAIMEHRAFETHGHLWALDQGHWSSTGRLPEAWRERFMSALGPTQEGGGFAYIVYSYHTPIGWVLRDGTTVTPDVKYSRTTTRHQGLLYVWNLAPEGRAALWDRARTERQQERDRAAQRREARRDAVARGYTPGGYYPPLRTQWEDIDPRPAMVTPVALLATEDPTASLEDRIAALETETFAQIGDTEALMRRAADALRNA